MVHRLEWRSDEPLDLGVSVARYNRWGADPVNHVEDGFYWRVFRHDETCIPYRASQEPDGTVVIEADDGDAAVLALDNLRHRLGGSLPRQPVAALAASDPVIGHLWHRWPGYRPPLGEDPFESIVTSITAQQVNLAWATTTRARLVAAFGTPVRWMGRDLAAFPTPHAIGSDPLQLRAMQFTTAKSEYIVGAARAAEDGFLDGIDSMADDDVITHATKLRGVGRWTADWLLARCLGRPRAVAGGDLGVRKAVGSIYLGNTEPPSEATVRETAAAWGDAANWATHLLLEGLSAD